MKKVKYFILLSFFFCIFISLFSLNSKIAFSNKKRSLSEEILIDNKEQIKNIEIKDIKDEINYKIYMEIKNLEKEEEKRKLEKIKELIEYNKERWERQINEESLNNKNDKYKKGKLIISCAYALDNAYVFPTIVAMTSLAENAGNKTFYSIYVLIDSSFSEDNKKIIKSVELNHIQSCEIIFKIIGDKFKNEKTDKRIKTPSYYRLELPKLLPRVKKIIWMDGDTAVFEDLTELININMKGNYIMGFLDSIPEAIDKFGIINSTVLCAGVLLMDLEALRKNDMNKKFEKFMVEQKDNINQHDQTIINVVCQGKIAPLPPKYGMWCFEAKIHALKHNRRQRAHLQYNEEEFLNAYYHPAILHYVWPKPYWRKRRPVFNKEWWDYAKKTGYINDILTKSPKYVRWLLL